MIRWLTGLALAIVVLTAVYIGSALFALSHLVAAVRAGDGPAIAAQTDLSRLGRSLSNQIVTAYLERIGATRRISPIGKALVGAYGTTVADALVAQLLTPGALAQILKTGRLAGVDLSAPLAELPSLTGLSAANPVELLGRLHLVNPVQIAVRTSDSSDPDGYAAVILHREGLVWKLAGIDLPRATRRALAASLPAK